MGIWRKNPKLSLNDVKKKTAEINQDSTNNSTNCNKIQGVLVNVEGNEFASTMINLDEDSYDKEVTIIFDEIPTLEDKTREDKESEYSKLIEDDKEKKLKMTIT